MYFTVDLKKGYNAYIDAAHDDMGTQMDVGLLILEEGDTYAICEAEKETAVLLFEGKATLRYGDKTAEISRKDCFHEEAYCLLAGCGTGPLSCPPIPTASCTSSRPSTLWLMSRCCTRLRPFRFSTPVPTAS